VLLKSRGDKRRQQVEASIASTPTSRLRTKPNLIFDTSQLRSITLKSSSFGTLITPDITLETKDGKRQKFGVQKPDFEKASAQLKQMFPAMCKNS
jgi:hypothetical protein